MIRWLVLLALAAGLAYCGSTVKLGNRTFFGHIRAIWATNEVQDLKAGVEEKAGPAAAKVKRGVSAGYKAMTDEEKAAAAAGSGAGSGSAGAGSGSAAGARSATNPAQ